MSVAHQFLLDLLGLSRFEVQKVRKKRKTNIQCQGHNSATLLVGNRNSLTRSSRLGVGHGVEDHNCKNQPFRNLNQWQMKIYLEFNTWNKTLTRQRDDWKALIREAMVQR